MTRGEYVVGKTFNPSALPEVDQIKTLAAGLIDAIDAIPLDFGYLEEHGEDDRLHEVQRLRHAAIEHVHIACMQAVAALTKPRKE